MTYHIGSVNTSADKYTRTAVANYSTLATYINKALDACGYTDAKLNASTTLKDVMMDDSLFSVIKTYVNKISASTLGSSVLSEGTMIQASDMDTIESKLNGSKIPTTLPCCETSGYENCISMQKGCIRVLA